MKKIDDFYINILIPFIILLGAMLAYFIKVYPTIVEKEVATNASIEVQKLVN